jgi:hypothetical protein
MKKAIVSAAAFAALAATHAVAADPAKIDWTAVPATTLVLFYPGLTISLSPGVARRA